MKIQIIVASLFVLSVSACGTYTPYRCTSSNPEICDLQKRVVLLEDRHAVPRKVAPKVMTDKELIDELNRRKRARTYAIPDK